MTQRYFECNTWSKHADGTHWIRKQMNGGKRMTQTRRFVACLLALMLLVFAARSFAQDHVVYEGKEGPGKGKHIVFLTGDEEYRSEEGLPMLAKILSQRHGFKCTVLFSIKNGEIDPNTKSNEPGMEALDSADLCIMLLRFREW